MSLLFRLLSLSLLSLCGCSLFFGIVSGLDECRDEDDRCDGEFSVICRDGEEVQIDCEAAGLSCDPEHGVCAICGDTLTQDVNNETCDDGNDIDNDGCSATCLLEFCGDGLRNNGDAQGGNVEECDDGNRINGDGCQADCRLPICGDGIIDVVLGEACDDGNNADNDGCSPVCIIERCGDGVIQLNLGEDCDDANNDESDECHSDCSLTCGDGIVLPQEACDDNNRVDLDGCNAECEAEFSFFCFDEPSECFSTDVESEPNDDGSPDIGGDPNGNDFAPLSANGPFNASTIISGSLSPAGDEDLFAISNTGAASVLVRIDSFDASSGLDVPCINIDTVLALHDEGPGALFGGNNDRIQNQDICAGLTFGLSPNQTIIAHIFEFGDDAEVPGYLLQVSFFLCGDGQIDSPELCDDGNTLSGDGCSADCLSIEPGFVCAGDPTVCRLLSCGDGLVDSPELCDDGNTLSGDGCSSICQIEPNFLCSSTVPTICSAARQESEPNEDGNTAPNGDPLNGNDFSTINAEGPFDTSTLFFANFSPPGDEDVFEIINNTAAPLSVRVDTFFPDFGSPNVGVGAPCFIGVGLDPVLNIRSANGTLLAQSNDRAPGDPCGGAEISIPSGQSVFAHILDFGDDDIPQGYVLFIDFAPAVCGDGTIKFPEECDDGNTANGDGCDSSCQSES